jgi:hypothetical protein
MNPLATDLDAFLAFVTPRSLHVLDRVDVFTDLVRHGRLLDD